MPTSGNYLLGIKLKRTVKTDVKGPLQQFIKDTYGHNAAEDSKESLDAIQALRDQVHGTAGSSVGIGMELFAKYLYALRAVEMRFPISAEKGHVNITFKWFDAFRDHLVTSQRNVHLEKAAILFCMAAVETQKATSGNERISDDDLKSASTALARASGLLAYLRDEVALKVESPKPVDLSGECLTLLEQLTLAQANEVFYENLARKVNAGSKAFNSATLACVAHAIARLYDNLAALYNNPQLEKHFDKEYPRSCAVKSVLYKCEAHYFQAKHHLAQEGLGHGVAIAHLRAAAATADGSKRQLQAAVPDLQRHAKALRDMVASARDKAEEENRRVYMNVVPEAPPGLAVKDNLLVKAIAPDAVFQRSEEYFQDIVPEAVTRRLSQYTAKLDDVVRGLLTRLETATDDARLALAKHDLPAVLDAMNPNRRELPDKALAALSDDFVARGPASQLREQRRLLDDLKRSTFDALATCKSALDEEERQEREMREKWGSSWTRPHSNVLNAEYRGSIARYEENLRTAAKSDERTAADLEAHGARIERLSVDTARSMIPTLEAPMVTTGASDPATVTANIRQLLAALDALSSERGALEERIKATREQDNVLPELMRIGSEGAQGVTESALAHYTAFEDEVERNVSRQGELLSVLAQTMGAFTALYDVEGWRIAVDGVAGQIRDDVLLGIQLHSRLSEGVQWYSEMSRAIQTLQARCSDFLMSRNIDLQERDNELTAKSKRSQEADANEKAARQLASLDVSGTSAQQGAPGASHASHSSHAAGAPVPQAPAYPAYQQQYPSAQGYPHAAPGGGPYGAPPPHLVPGHPLDGGGAPGQSTAAQNPYPTQHAPPQHPHAPHDGQSYQYAYAQGPPHAMYAMAPPHQGGHPHQQGHQPPPPQQQQQQQQQQPAHSFPVPYAQYPPYAPR